MTCPPARLQDEISYLALHLHWSLDDLLDLEHADRRGYLARVERLVGGGR